MYTDPRGPIRTIVAVDSKIHGRVTLSCGHIRDLNPIYHYRKSDPCRCFACVNEQT